MRNEYYSIHDDCSVVGFGFCCTNCKEDVLFVDEDSSTQSCPECKFENVMEVVSYE